LVNAASTLIAVFEKVRQSVRHSDVPGLHRRLVHEINQFSERAKETGVRPEIVVSARYLLCTALDEAVLHTPWGGESAWGQNTLLSAFYKQANGGEKCFAILDHMLQAPAENRDMLELFYVVISLGFEGKYRISDRGRDQLERLRDDLYRTIRNQRGDFERSLSTSWQGLGHTRRTLSHFVPMWVAASVFAAVVFIGYLGFGWWMRSESNPVVDELRVIAGLEKAPDSQVEEDKIEK